MAASSSGNKSEMSGGSGDTFSRASAATSRASRGNVWSPWWSAEANEPTRGSFRAKRWWVPWVKFWGWTFLPSGGERFASFPRFFVPFFR
jgi:hypothetical protein